jgi:hypothetical protein
VILVFLSLISLSIMLSNSPHFPANNKISVFSLWLNNIPICKYFIYFIYSFISSWHIGWSQFGYFE